MFTTKRESKLGFTIIELLIVIAIIAILAAVAIPALLKAQRSGRESAALQVLRSLRSAEEAFKQKSPMPRHYTNLDGLKADNACTMGEAGLEPTSGYTFTSVAGIETYTIVAIPPKTDMTTYSLLETGDLKP